MSLTPHEVNLLIVLALRRLALADRADYRRRNPGPKHLAKLAEVLGLQVTDLLPKR